MKFFPILCFVLLLSSCTKDQLNCVARDAQGEAMYEVVGTDLCEEQIRQEYGEYCDCAE